MECAGTDGGCRTWFVDGLSAPARRCGTSSRLCLWSDVADRGYGARVRVNQEGGVPIEEYEAQRNRLHHHRIALAREPQYVIANVSTDTEMVSAAAFDTTIIETSLLR
jgi:hypothetical protein